MATYLVEVHTVRGGTKKTAKRNAGPATSATHTILTLTPKHGKTNLVRKRTIRFIEDMQNLVNFQISSYKN